MRDTLSGSGGEGAQQQSRICFIVESAGETLLVGARGTSTELEMLKVDVTRAWLEPIKSLGNHAIIIGLWRCLSVDADKFPSIQGNCMVLYNDTEGTMTSVDITDTSQRHEDQDVPALIHLLFDYCSNIPHSELGEERHYEEFVQAILAAMRNAASGD